MARIRARCALKIAVKIAANANAECQKGVCDELAWAGALGPFNGLHVDGSTHAQPAWLVGLQRLRGHGARREETEHGAGLAHPQLLNLEANQ